MAPTIHALLGAVLLGGALAPTVPLWARLEPTPATAHPLAPTTTTPTNLSPGTAELVKRLEAKDPEVVIRSLMALGLTRDRAAFVPILHLLETRADSDIRAAALMTLEKLDYTVPFLVSVLEDSSQPAVAQAFAAYMLGRMQAKEAIPALTAALDSPQATVREHAINALGAIGDMKAWKPLVVAAHKDPSPVLRARAEETAEKLATASTRSELDAGTLNVQLQSQDVQARRAAATALASKGNYWSVPLLIEALNDPDDEVRRLAARALGDLQDRRAVAPLMDFLPGASGRTLYTALVALGVLQDRTAVPAIIPFLQHPDPEARRFAIRALANLGDPAAGPPLRKVLADPVPKNRLEAAEALGRLRDPGAVPMLKTMARKDVEANRYAAIRALGAIATPEAVDALLELLRVKDTIAVVTAINALRAAGAEAAVPALEEMSKKHGEQWVREEALRAAVEIRGKARLKETSTGRAPSGAEESSPRAH